MFDRARTEKLTTLHSFDCVQSFYSKKRDCSKSGFNAPRGCGVLLTTLYNRYQMPILYDSDQPTSTNTLVAEFSIHKVILYQFIAVHLTLLFDHNHSEKCLYFLLILVECSDLHTV